MKVLSGLALLSTISGLKIPLFNYPSTQLPFTVQPFISDVGQSSSRLLVQSSSFTEELKQARDYFCELEDPMKFLRQGRKQAEREFTKA